LNSNQFIAAARPISLLPRPAHVLQAWPTWHRTGPPSAPPLLAHPSPASAVSMCYRPSVPPHSGTRAARPPFLSPPHGTPSRHPPPLVLSLLDPKQVADAPTAPLLFSHRPPPPLDFLKPCVCSSAPEPVVSDWIAKPSPPTLPPRGELHASALPACLLRLLLTRLASTVLQDLPSATIVH
jgi:hypothetical protein